jgi:hypothetical protein
MVIGPVARQSIMVGWLGEEAVYIMVETLGSRDREAEALGSPSRVTTVTSLPPIRLHLLLMRKLLAHQPLRPFQFQTSVMSLQCRVEREWPASLGTPKEHRSAGHS